jgi:hypothetical protein
MRTRTLVVMALLVGSAVGPSGVVDAAAGSAGHAVVPAALPTLRADFDGDGYQDLAVGSPLEAVGAVRDAGTVFVLYGSAAGLTGAGSQLFNQASPGIAGDPEEFDRFGSALVAADFDADGFTDLAVAAEEESVGRVPRAGVVHVLRGSAAGLRTTGSLLLTQDTAGVGSTVEASDLFGSALAAGDFNADQVDDLAVGARGEQVGSVEQAGAAFVLYGARARGLSGAGSTLLTQGGTAVPSEPEPTDLFGSALAAADFDVDGIADLAIGVPFESLGDVVNAGTFHVLPGTAAGATGTGSQTFTQDSPGIGSTAEARDGFGFSLAATTSGPAGIAPG